MGKNLEDHLSEIPDFRRRNKNFRHELLDILMLSICAIFSGAEDFEEIAFYGEQKEAFLKRFIKLENGIPSHDTIRRVFMHLDSKMFNTKFMAWVSDTTASLGIDFQHISIDGKTLRGSKSGIHLVSAVASGIGLSLGQVKVDQKSNEITAIPELLDLLTLKGCIVSIDAMGCQRAICRQIHESGADYFIALKGNQPELFDGVKEQFLRGYKGTPMEKSLFKGNHNQVVTYRVSVCKDMDWLCPDSEWPYLKTLVRVEASTEKRSETRYYLSSIEGLTPRQALNLSIGHWSIENQLHWQLDVTLGEDRQRHREGFAPQNLSILRKILLNMAYLHVEKLSKKKIIKKMAWDEQFFLEMMAKLFNFS